MADYDSRPEQRAMNRKKKRKLKSIEEEEEDEGPSKASRIEDIKEPTEEAEHMETTEILEDSPPWRNLQLILSLQKKNLHTEKKVELAYHYLKPRVSDEADDKSLELELVSVPRVILFLNNWAQSILISSEKKIRVEGSKPELGTGASCLDYRCWGIFKFCLEEGLKLHVSLSFSRDILRVIHCIARNALSQLIVASPHPEARDLDDEEFKFYNTVLNCISSIFTSHGGVSNENLDLWVSMVDTILELVLKVVMRKVDGDRVSTMVLHLSCLVLEPFTRFLRVHPTRKNGFREFVDRLLEPLLCLLEVLPSHIHGCNPGWMDNLLNLVEEVLSQGLFHPSQIEGFLSLQSLVKYKRCDDGKLKDSKTVIKSYHRHLFDKLENIVAGKNALALGGEGELFRLYIQCIKKQEGVQVTGVLRHSGDTFKKSSGSSNVVSEKSHCSSALSAETRKSLFDFFVQIMEPLLCEIDNYLQAELEVGPLLLDVLSTLKSTSRILFSFMHENVYVRAEDTSEGACLSFLKVVYDKITSFSAKINQLLPSTFGVDGGTDKEVVKLVAKELLVSIRYLVEIEYEVVGNNLESLWLMMFSYGPLLHSLTDLADQSLLSEILHLGCHLVKLYGELRQVSTSVFALCKAVRRLVLSIRDVELCYSKYMTCTCSLYYESWAKSSMMILCSPEFRLSIYNAIKSLPEGQVSGCIRELTTDISESLEWMKGSCSLPTEKELAKTELNGCSSSCFDLKVEFFGRGLSEVYTLILDSLTVTTGNSSLVGVSLKGLIAIISPSMSILVSRPLDGVYEFLSIVLGRALNKESGCENEMLSAHWFFLFFFRLYMSCRSLCRQAISLAPPDASKKMSEVMRDSFTAYSGNDWLKRCGGVEEGYFSWIVQPSASLLVVIEAISDICFQDTAKGCSPLIYILNAMALQRLVDLNRLIKSFEFLLKRNDNLISIKVVDDDGQSDFRKQSRRWKKYLSALRQEAAGLTNLMMGYLPLVSKGQPFSSSSEDAWDFGVGAINKKSLPSAFWCIICQNIDIWSTHASKKKLKMFLSHLIRNSLACSSISLSDFGKQSSDNLGNLKAITVHEISFELLRDTLFYEQTFVRRHMASRFCRLLEESVSPIFGHDGAVDLKSPPNWPEVLHSLESSSVVSNNDNVVNNCSSGAKPISQINRTHLISCNEQGVPSTSMKYTTCQNLLNYLCWMPKGYLSSRAFSLYATCILNFERLIVGTLLGCCGAPHLHDGNKLLRLFLYCRRTLKHLMVSFCDEKMEAGQHSLTPIHFGGTFPALWLLKSLLLVTELQMTYLKDGIAYVKDLMFSLMDYTSYLFLTFSKVKFIYAIRSHISSGEPCEQKPKSAVHQEEEGGLTELNSCLDSSEDIDDWDIVVHVAETLREQAEHLLIPLRKAICNGRVEGCANVIKFKKLSSITACFQGFLWGLASALGHIDGGSSNLKAIFLRTKFEPIIKINLCIETYAKFISYFLCEFVLEDDKLSQSLMTGCNGDFLGLKCSSHIVSGDASDILYDKGPKNSQPVRNISVLSGMKDVPNKTVLGKRPHLKSADAGGIMTEVDLFGQQSLKLSFLRKLLEGENLEEAFFLRQLFVACSAILRLNFHINSTSLLSKLVAIFIGISQILLPEFVNKVQMPSPFTFVWLDGVAKFLEELGNRFPLTNPTLSQNVYAKLIDLHLKAIGKCISLQGKGANLASHETESSTKTLVGQLSLSEYTQSNGPACLNDFKSRLRMSFKVFIRNPSELHLLSAIQSIERALVGVQEGCMTNYQIQTGILDGGKISSIVAAGIDCFDLVLEFITGRKRLSLVKRHIQSLVACLFNIILHLQGPKVFYAHRIPNAVGTDPNPNPDPGSIVLMCIEVLTKVSGKHALYQMDTCYVAQALRVPATLFQIILQLRISNAPAQSPLLRSSNVEGTDSVEGMNTWVVDRQFSVDLYAACCRLLCTFLRHHKRESQLCIALLEDSVRVLLCCLEMVDIDLAVRKSYFAWEVQEGVKCACFLRRIYEEIRQQKDVLGRHCSLFLSNYIWIYSGYGPLKAGFRREIDEALRPGVYALIDACSADDLQYIHTVLGEGPCRSTLANLQHDYKLNFQYEGKV